MNEHLDLTVSANTDAAMLARRFVEGVSRRYDFSADTATALKVLASDAATDATRAGHSIAIRVECHEEAIAVAFHGDGFQPPAVVSPPDGLRISGTDRLIEVEIRR